MPVAVGVPLMVMVLLFQFADSPAGNPVAAPIPVAPVVVKVMSGDKANFTHRAGDAEALLTVLVRTVMVPVAFTAAHPPDKGIE